MEIETASADNTTPSSPSPSPAPSATSSSSSPSPVVARAAGRGSKRLSGEQSSAADAKPSEETEVFTSSGRRVRALVKTSTSKESIPSPKTSRPSGGRRSKNKKDTVQRMRVTTAVCVNRIPYIYDEILKRLPAEVKDLVDVFELQGLVVATSLDDDLFQDSADPETSMIEHILGLVKKDDKYLRDPNSTRRRVMDSKFMTEKQADEEALRRYNDYINSPANQRLLSYRTDSATRHIWTEGDIKRFFEAFKKYGNGPTSNRQIAKHIGSSVHPNHVAHFKQQLRKKQKEEKKKQVQAERKKTTRGRKGGGKKKKKKSEDYEEETETESEQEEFVDSFEAEEAEAEGNDDLKLPSSSSTEDISAASST